VDRNVASYGHPLLVHPERGASSADSLLCRPCTSLHRDHHLPYSLGPLVCSLGSYSLGRSNAPAAEVLASSEVVASLDAGAAVVLAEAVALDAGAAASSWTSDCAVAEHVGVAPKDLLHYVVDVVCENYPHAPALVRELHILCAPACSHQQNLRLRLLTSMMILGVEQTF